MSNTINELSLNEIETVVGGVTAPAVLDQAALGRNQQVPPPGNREVPRHGSTSTMPPRPTGSMNAFL